MARFKGLLRERNPQYNDVRFCELLAWRINAGIEATLFEIDFWTQSDGTLDNVELGYPYSGSANYSYIVNTAKRLYQSGVRCSWR